MSVEPRRSSAYSDDLRWRMVYQIEGLQLNYSTVAKNLNVDASTVKRVVGIFRATGNVKKKQYPKERRYRKITHILQFFILDLVLCKPGIYLWEIQTKVIEEFCVSLDCSTICRFLHKCGFTHQKLRIVALQRDEEQRLQYSIDISLYNSDMLVFIDETGCDKRNLIRKKGYSIRGKPAISHQLLIRGEHISVIAAISTKGLLDIKICRGGVDSDTFCEFVSQNLLLHLYPFCNNNPQSVVVLDNCRIHHTNDSIRALQEVGSMVHFLPPYSPDYNPIENIFSKVKTVIKQLEAFDTSLDIDELILQAFATIAPADCKKSIASVVYY